MYIIVIPFNKHCLTYLYDTGYKGATLCYRRSDALGFETVEDAELALQVIKAPTTAYIERMEQ